MVNPMAIQFRRPEFAGGFSMSVMAFHEKAGPGQADFDLPFLKIHLPS
jgi:hypothetical protein